MTFSRLAWSFPPSSVQKDAKISHSAVGYSYRPIPGQPGQDLAKEADYLAGSKQCRRWSSEDDDRVPRITFPPVAGDTIPELVLRQVVKVGSCRLLEDFALSQLSRHVAPDRPYYVYDH